jgi:hypothetical protein
MVGGYAFDTKEHEKKIRNSDQAAQTQACSRLATAQTQASSRFATGAFAAALSSIPSDAWGRTWPADRTMMLRRTSKRVKEAVDKLRLPTVLNLNKAFWNNLRYGTPADKLQHILTQLEKMTYLCSITKLVLSGLPRAAACSMSCRDVGRLAGVLEQCTALSDLTLDCAAVGADGAGILAGALSQSPAQSTLRGLSLYYNRIGDDGVGRFAKVLPQLCTLALGSNQIGDEGLGTLARVLPQCLDLGMLCLGGNLISDAGAERLAGVLPQCPRLLFLFLENNHIGNEGGKHLARVLPQCPALSFISLIGNQIGYDAAQRFAEVLPQCPNLTIRLWENSEGYDSDQSY